MRTFTRFTIIALAALAAFGASSAQASADMLFVCAEAGACQYSSIQAAVDAADGSDTIRVRSGTYDEAVTIPAGKTGLTLVGAQAGVAANVGDRPLSGEESVLSAGAGGIALRVNSWRVTIDGFVIRDSAEGVRSDAETSGLRVVNSAFVANDSSIVPDSTGDLQTVIEHNTFLETRATYAIFTRKSRGRLVVSENRIEAGRLVGIIALPSRDVTVRGNRGTGGDILAVLGNVEGGLIEDNVVNNTDGLALLSGTRDVTVRSNILSSSGRRFGVVLSRELGTSSETTIEGNDFSGSKELEAIYVDYHSLSDTLVARYNRFAPTTRGVRAGGDQRVDARYNWWGCNEGPGAAGCASVDESDGANVTRSPWLTLSIETGAERIANASGGTTSFRVSLLRDAGGTVHRPSYFPHVSFSVGTLAGSDVDGLRPLELGVLGGTLIAKGGQGTDLTAGLDSATVRRHVAFGPLPGQGADGTPVPTRPAATVNAPRTAGASSCTASARALSCLLTGRAARVSRGRRVNAALYRSGRRIAAGRVRIARGKVNVRVGRRVSAGRYTLVLARGGRRLARQTVEVTPRAIPR